LKNKRITVRLATEKPSSPQTGAFLLLEIDSIHVNDEQGGAMSQIKIKGTRGSWFARAGNEILPCVHKEWFMPKDSHHPYPHYADAGVKVGEKQWDALIAGIKASKKVILTNDRWSETKNFVRTGYIAIWNVDNIVVTNGMLYFDFIKRVAEAK
jgi:hypothetical protein